LSNRIKSDDIQIGQSYVLPIEKSKVTVQQAKVQQIIEETDARAQGIIDGAENKSKIIIQTANTEAERIIEQARQKAQQEYDTIKNQAYQEGFSKGEQDGLSKFQHDAIDALNSLETLASSEFDMKKNIIDSATLDIVELVAAIADKVCHAKFDNDVLYRIALDAIKEINEKENITIIVNPKLVENISSMVEGFKNEFANLDSVRIVEDNSVSPDGVIVETLSTRLDSRISAQIAAITEKMLTGANDELE
jgi:flagellar assembly protein FliH